VSIMVTLHLMSNMSKEDESSRLSWCGTNGGCLFRCCWRKVDSIHGFSAFVSSIRASGVVVAFLVDCDPDAKVMTRGMVDGRAAIVQRKYQRAHDGVEFLCLEFRGRGRLLGVHDACICMIVAQSDPNRFWICVAN
jgi:hypothetical protein